MADIATLPARLDTANAAGLAAHLSTLRGTDVSLDGSAVNSAGTLGLQVLVSARRTWTQEGRVFEIVAPSDALTAACQGLGIDPDSIGLCAGKEA